MGGNTFYVLARGKKKDELSNHLGNVLAVISDRKIQQSAGWSASLGTYAPDVLSYTDYYAFFILSGVEGGWEMLGRNGGSYRYGFNGQEEDPELWGGAVSFEYRVEDARVGRFFSVDPITAQYPWYTPYQVAGNMMIMARELEGLEPESAVYTWEQRPGYGEAIRGDGVVMKVDGWDVFSRHISSTETQYFYIPKTEQKWVQFIPVGYKKAAPINLNNSSHLAAFKQGQLPVGSDVKLARGMAVTSAVIAAPVVVVGAIEAGLGLAAAKLVGWSTDLCITKMSISVTAQTIANHGDPTQIDIVDVAADGFLAPGSGSLTAAMFDLKYNRTDGFTLAVAGINKDLENAAIDASVGFVANSTNDALWREVGEDVIKKPLIEAAQFTATTGLSSTGGAMIGTALNTNADKDDNQ